LLHLLIRSLLAPPARLLYRPVVRGADNIPERGPVLLAANHHAAVDTAVLGVVSPRSVKFLGKAEYFAGRGVKGRLFAGFLSALGYVPVERGNAKAGLAALEAARTVLDAGGVFGIYPEGTRSLDGRLHRGHTGVAALALATGAVVVPVALSGTEKVQPVGKRIPGSPVSACASVRRSTSPVTPDSMPRPPSAEPSPTRSCTRSWNSRSRSTWTRITSTRRRTRRRTTTAITRRRARTQREPARTFPGK
jgi:1-acyl-sn-glycerol-3-phosphate acyltransferase